MQVAEFVQVILNWYCVNQRDLPWRKEKDPYKIWLSEIILQQTRVAQGLPYYYKFINEFPNITSMAASEEEKILKLWEGLGYYSRARNMHQTAKILTEKYEGVFPETYEDILKLKGIGEYTAGAIASFAFGTRVPIVDGNVYRVLSRVFGIDTDILSSAGKKEFRHLADSLLPDKNVGDYNQALMEFGALQCIPAKPSCDHCPLFYGCFARENKRQQVLPVKIKKTTKKVRDLEFLVLRFAQYLIVEKRTGNDIWKNLYQFPLKTLELEFIRTERTSGMYKHILSHQVLQAVFHEKNFSSLKELLEIAEKTGGKVVSPDELAMLPKPVLINKYLKDSI